MCDRQRLFVNGTHLVIRRSRCSSVPPRPGNTRFLFQNSMSSMAQLQQQADGYWVHSTLEEMEKEHFDPRSKAYHSVTWDNLPFRHDDGNGNSKGSTLLVEGMHPPPTRSDLLPRLDAQMPPRNSVTQSREENISLGSSSSSPPLGAKQRNGAGAFFSS